MTKSLAELTDAEYRALKYESYSSIKYLLESPAVYLYYKGAPFKGSDSTLLGTTIHHYLQGNKHLVAFSIIDKRKKEEYAAFEKEFKEAAGEEGIIVPASFEEKILSIMKNYNDHPQAPKMLAKCTFETPFIFEYNGVFLKGKADGHREGTVVEIKTSSMAQDHESFKREAKNRDYDLQAALYCYGLQASEHYFIVCGTTPPYTVNVYKSSAQFLQTGADKAQIVTERYKKHILNGEQFNENDNIEEI